MLKDKEGNRLFRKVVVHVDFPDNIFPPKNFVQHAGPKQGFGPKAVENIVDGLADQLDTLYPYWNFRVVELKPDGRTAKYKFLFAGYVAIPETPQDKLMTRSNTSIPGVANSVLQTDEVDAIGNSISDPQLLDSISQNINAHPLAGGG